MPKPNYYFVGDCGPNYFTECLIAYWLWRTFPFVLLFIGTCGNILNIIVLSGKQLRKYSTTVIILFLAVTELVVLWTSLVPDAALSIVGRRLDDDFPVVCRLRTWIVFTSGSYSTWLLVLLTLERILFTKAPVFSRKKVTPRNTLIASLVVLFAIACMNSHTIYGHHFHDIGHTAESTAHNSSDVNTPFRCYYISAEYGKFFTYYWNIFVLAIYNIVPASIIIVGNITIASVILFRRARFVARVHPVSDSVENVQRKSPVKLLCILSIFYVVTTTPFCIYFLLRWRSTAELTAESFAKWQLATAVVNILLWCNFSFNFFFYFVSGTLFRKEWTRLLNKVQSCFKRQNEVS